MKKKIRENLSFKDPCGIDMDEKNILYIADENNVTLVNLKLEIISSWKLPQKNTGFGGLKIDNKTVYLTIAGIHQIFLCQSEDGKVLKKYGTVDKGSKPGEFNRPCGITVNGTYVYICDCSNHRIQILIKENGTFSYQWGKGKESTEKGHFSYPRSIYYNVLEEMFYIGDSYSVQLFRKDNTCIQRLGDTTDGNKMNQFYNVWGLSVVNDQLYVSDFNNKRIQIFRRIQ